MTHVWICQCLCPDRHCIMAAVNEAENEAHVQRLKTELRRQVLRLLKAGALNPWCAICGAKLATWRYELGRSRFATMEEAKPHLQQSQGPTEFTRAALATLRRRWRDKIGEGRMTDLERARWLLPDGTDEVEVRELAGVIAAARREGAEAAVVKLKAEAVAEARRESAEEMRERAAQLAHDNGFGETAAAIRALPLTPEEH